MAKSKTPPPIPFATRWVADLLGLTPSKVEHYKRLKMVIPKPREGSVSTGRGVVNEYSPENIVEIALIRFLSTQGISLDTIAEVFNIIRKAKAEGHIQFNLDPKQKFKPTDRYVLEIWRDHDGNEEPVVSRGKTLEKEEKSKLSRDIRHYSIVIAVNLIPIIQDVANRLEGV